MKLCQYEPCAKPLERKRYPGGRTETDKQFAAKRYCDRTCSNRAKRRGGRPRKTPVRSPQSRISPLQGQKGIPTPFKPAEAKLEPAVKRSHGRMDSRPNPTHGKLEHLLLQERSGGAPQRTRTRREIARAMKAVYLLHGEVFAEAFGV